LVDQASGRTIWQSDVVPSICGLSLVGQVALAWGPLDLVVIDAGPATSSAPSQATAIARCGPMAWS